MLMSVQSILLYCFIVIICSRDLVILFLFLILPSIHMHGTKAFICLLYVLQLIFKISSCERFC